MRRRTYALGAISIAMFAAHEVAEALQRNEIDSLATLYLCISTGHLNAGAAA